MLVLIVDDEPQIGEVLSAYLQRESFETVVCEDVASAVASLEKRRPDIMLLDITLPDGSGLDILKQANKAHRIPTIMLTARSEEVDRVIGLELGADDYIVKPFSPREVVARVRAVLRRTSQPQNGNGEAEHVLQVKDLQIDTGAHEER